MPAVSRIAVVAATNNSPEKKQAVGENSTIKIQAFGRFVCGNLGAKMPCKSSSAP
jgi:hypothetical protein